MTAASSSSIACKALKTDSGAVDSGTAISRRVCETLNLWAFAPSQGPLPAVKIESDPAERFEALGALRFRLAASLLANGCILSLKCMADVDAAASKASCPHILHFRRLFGEACDASYRQSKFKPAIPNLKEH